MKRLTMSVKKILYPRKELERWITGIRSDEMSSRSTCTSCGNNNRFGSSFCSKCGCILK
ncbi:protein of unknown function [Candidatus Nitrosotalea okcheonensis]|uniref:Zinc-ribbon domain-containing protein n=1 Tax=Candidatus Nitrosotalea okcheonensis TaxID=1903276 RepID=A0A2H1FFM7_9ARCH|nr:protein of unknown function [Candidatus Nitrosotalea okcheonensis]